MAHFQQFKNKVLKGLPFAFAYFDDILVFHEKYEKHLEYLWTVFDRMRTVGLKFKKRSKMTFQM